MLPCLFERHRLNFHRTCVLLVSIHQMSTVTNKQRYYQKVAWKASRNEPDESIVYAVLVEFLVLHKNPPFRFIIYPQMSLKWQPSIPQDTREEIADLGLVIFTQDSFKIRCGVEAKRATLIMDQLPDARYLINNMQVIAAFRLAFSQAMDQAKAAFKNDYIFDRTQPVYWMLVVGPYWTATQFGPFSDAELTVRTHKKLSSEDFLEWVSLNTKIEEEPFELQELFCFNTQASSDRIEEILQATDAAANSITTLMMNPR